MGLALYGPERGWGWGREGDDVGRKVAHVVHAPQGRQHLMHDIVDLEAFERGPSSSQGPETRHEHVGPGRGEVAVLFPLCGGEEAEGDAEGSGGAERDERAEERGKGDGRARVGRRGVGLKGVYRGREEGDRVQVWEHGTQGWGRWGWVRGGNSVCVVGEQDEWWTWKTSELQVLDVPRPIPESRGPMPFVKIGLTVLPERSEI